MWKKVGEVSGKGGGSPRAKYKGRKGFFIGWTKEYEYIVRRPGNTSIRDLMSDRRFIGPVLDFLRATEVGKVKEGFVLSPGAP